MSTPLIAKTVELAKATFQASKKLETIECGYVVSGKHSPPWYSAGAVNLPVTTSELFFFRDGRLSAWVGSMFQSQHKISLAFKSQNNYKFIACGHCKDSGVMVWPCTFVQLPRSSVTLVKPAFDTEEPVVMAIGDLDLLECWSFRF